LIIKFFIWGEQKKVVQPVPLEINKFTDSKRRQYAELGCL
jgi:hypothetical protein